MRLDSPVGRAVQRVSGSPAFARWAPPVVTRLDKAVHRLSGGRWMVSRGLLPTLVLTATGARSGQPRTVPLACFPDGDDFYVVGSNFGRRSHPAWSNNLIATPRATVSFAGREFPVEAHLLDQAEKEAVWPRLRAAWPNYDVYADRSGRELRVFRLRPSG